MAGRSQQNEYTCIWWVVNKVELNPTKKMTILIFSPPLWELTLETSSHPAFLVGWLYFVGWRHFWITTASTILLLSLSSNQHQPMGCCHNIHVRCWACWIQRLQLRTQKKSNESCCPPLYTHELFIQGFGLVFYTKHFNWLLRSDPKFGSNSHVQTARLYTEQIYLMLRDFQIFIETTNGRLNQPSLHFSKPWQILLI